MTFLETIADAMERDMFAPHELPLGAELHGRYLQTAQKVLDALNRANVLLDIANRPEDAR